MSTLTFGSRKITVDFPAEFGGTPRLELQGISTFADTAAPDAIATAALALCGDVAAKEQATIDQRRLVEDAQRILGGRPSIFGLLR